MNPRRLAWVALGVAGLALAQPASAPLPTPPASAAASAASPASSAAPMRLPTVFSIDARLPPVTLGRSYPPLPLIRSGQQRLEVSASDELLPSGLRVGSDAVLRGVAREPGLYRFTLTVRDRDSHSLLAELPFALRVNPPAAAVKAAPRAASAAASAPPAPPAPAAVVRREPPSAAFWQLTEQALQAWSLDPARKAAATARCAGSEVEQALMDQCEKDAKADQSWANAVLAPLLGAWFPSEGLFAAAVQEGRRAACSGPLPTDPAPAWTCSAPAPALPPVASLPGDLVGELPRLARQARDPAGARAPHWTGEGCGCGPAVSDSVAYGLYPFWAAGEDAAPQAVDFSAFTRIGVMGGFVQTDGALLMSRGWNDHAGDGWRVAQDHGTRLDLVLYRQSWAAMLARDDAALDSVAERAADEAVKALAQSRFSGFGDRLLQGLLWPWQPPAYLYDGLTLWLDYTPEATAGAAPTLQDRRYARFASALVTALIDRLQVVPRDLALQLVVPGAALGDPASPWRVKELLRHLRQAVPLAHERERRRELEMAVLVLLPEPLAETDWAVREVLYRSEDLEQDAVQSASPDLLVRSLLPVTLVPAKALDPETAARVAKRLADHDWQYGGVSLWPLPQAVPGAGPALLIPQLHAALRDDKYWWTDQNSLTRRACPWVCPNRVPLRLGFEGLLLAVAAALALWAGSCRVNALGWRYLGAVILLLTLAAGIGFALLSCDPLLAELSASNWLLAAVVGLALVAALWVAFRRRVAQP